MTDVVIALVIAAVLVAVISFGHPPEETDENEGALTSSDSGEVLPGDGEVLAPADPPPPPKEDTPFVPIPDTGETEWWLP